MNNNITLIKIIVDYVKDQFRDNPLKFVADEAQLDEVIEEWSSEEGLIRDNPCCSCDDEHCPHKAKISPMALIVLHDTISKCFKPTINPVEYFNPKNYPLNVTDNLFIPFDLTYLTKSDFYVRYKVK